MPSLLSACRNIAHWTASVDSGNDVELRTFGVVELRLTNARVGRIPKNPETDVPIPARSTVKFKSGKVMRQRVLLRPGELSKVDKQKAAR